MTEQQNKLDTLVAATEATHAARRLYRYLKSNESVHRAAYLQEREAKSLTTEQQEANAHLKKRIQNLEHDSVLQGQYRIAIAKALGMTIAQAESYRLTGAGLAEYIIDMRLNTEGKRT